MSEATGQAQVGRRRSEIGQGGGRGEVFSGWRVEVGQRKSEADEKERKNFFLETPYHCNV